MIIPSSNNPPGHVPMEREEVDIKKAYFTDRLKNETDYKLFEEVGLEAIRFIEYNTEGPFTRAEALDLQSLYLASLVDGERIHKDGFFTAIAGMGIPH